MKLNSKRITENRCCAPDIHHKLLSIMRLSAGVAKVYLYPKQVYLQTSFDGLVDWVKLGTKVVAFNTVLFVFLNHHRNSGKVLNWVHTASAFGSSASKQNASRPHLTPPTEPLS